MFSLSNDEWLIIEEGFNKDELNWREGIFSLSNGSLGVRGSLEEMPEGSMPGVYLGGLFNRGDSWTWDMINNTNFLPVEIFAGTSKFGVDTCHLLEHKRVLDMKQGLLYRNTTLQHSDGRIINWKSWRLVSSVERYLCVEKHSITPMNFSGEMVINPVLDAGVLTFDTFLINKVKHYEIVDIDHQKNTLFAICRLSESRKKVVSASETVFEGETAFSCIKEGERIRASHQFYAEEGKAIVFERYSSVQSYLQHEDDVLLDNTLNLLEKAKNEGFERILELHKEKIWTTWENSDFRIEGDAELQKKIRFNIFSLIQAGPSGNERASIGARGLTGERYRGHIYWDTEMFMLPFYVFNDPGTARDILKYRYHMLQGARRNAERSYTQGARFPYQSADLGDEASPLFGPRWNTNAPDRFTNPIYHFCLSLREIHISAAVVYGIMLYYRMTGDKDFMLDYGLEMLLEVSRYWCSRMEWVDRNKRYELIGVIGPDEFHENVDNNAYTNYMAGLNIQWAIDQLEEFKIIDSRKVHDLIAKIRLTEEEIEKWRRKKQLLYLPTPNPDKIIEQFDGYFNLPDYSRGDMHPVDLIKIEFSGNPVPNMAGKDLATYQDKMNCRVVKQCDLILLMAIFPDLFDSELVKKNYDYYEIRTMHASSLSPNTSSIVGLRNGRGQHAYDLLNLSASIDIDNIQGNTKHGLHMAAIGGTWMSCVYGFGGVYITKDFRLEIRPVLCNNWKSIRYRLYLGKSQIEVFYDGRLLTLELLKGKPVEVVVRGQPLTIDGIRTMEYEVVSLQH